MTKELSYFFKVALFSISGFWKNAYRIKIKEIWSFQKGFPATDLIAHHHHHHYLFLMGHPPSLFYPLRRSFILNNFFWSSKYKD